MKDWTDCGIYPEDIFNDRYWIFYDRMTLEQNIQEYIFFSPDYFQLHSATVGSISPQSWKF